MKGGLALIIAAVVTITLGALLIGHAGGTAKVIGAGGRETIGIIQAGSLQNVQRGA